MESMKATLRAESPSNFLIEGDSARRVHEGFGCFVNLRLLKITGKNRRNSLLKAETVDFFGESRGCYCFNFALVEFGIKLSHCFFRRCRCALMQSHNKKLLYGSRLAAVVDLQFSGQAFL